MTQITTFAKQVSSRIEAMVQTLKRGKTETDDTVEAQAQTFRIWMWSSAAGLAIVVIASVVSMARQSANSHDDASSAIEKSMLDSLPDGYVIAPLDPTNIEALDSIFENHGYADLYRASGAGDSTSSRGALIARGLPLIRAPKNPRRFAVLVADGRSDILSGLNEPVLVVLRKKPSKTIGDGKSKTRRESPLAREAKGNIELIQEEIPESSSPNEPGARS